MIEKSLYVCVRSDIYIALKEKTIKLVKKTFDREETLIHISKPNAIILSFCNGTRQVSELIKTVSDLFNISTDSADKLVSDVLETYYGFLDFRHFIFNRSDIEATDNIIKFKAHSPSKYLSTIVRRKVQRLVLFITDECNANCIYCCIGNSIKKSNFDSLTIENVEYLLTQAKEMGIPEIEITGGDPFAHRDIFKILSRVISLGFELFISTKVPLSREMVDKLKEIGLQKISLSLDTIDPLTYETLMGLNRNALEKTLNGISYLNEANIKKVIKITITSLNIKNIPNMIKKLYSDYKCDEFMLQAYSRGDCYILKLFASVEDYLVLDEEINTIIKKEQIKIVKAYNIEKIRGSKKYLHISRMFCMAGKNAINVYPNGKYGFCAHSLDSNLAYGHINEMTLKQSWYCKELMNFINPSRELYKGTKCENCNDFEECNKRRCYVRTLLEFKKLREIDPLCQYSDIDF